MKVAKDTHGETLDAPVWSPLGFGRGHPVHFLSDSSARIDYGGGRHGIGFSSVPLRSSVASGQPQPTDLHLSQSASGFAPVNPLGVTSIPGRAQAPAQVGDIGISLGAAKDQPAVQSGDKVIFANTTTDTDTLVTPQPGGLEIFYQLRSQRGSPEDLRLRFGLPAGATLRVATGPSASGVEIVRGGQVIATVPNPTARDAQGQSVPVTYVVQGDELLMHVAHRGGDYAYPIMVDPQIVYNWNSGRNNDAGWGTYQNNSYYWCGGFTNWYQGQGLYIFARNPGACQGIYQNAGDVIEWNYYGEFWRYSDAYVYGVEEYSSFDPGWGGMSRYSGIYSVGLNNWEVLNPPDPNPSGLTYRAYCPPATASHPYCDPGNGTPSNYAVFGTRADTTGNHGVYTNYLQAENVYVADRDRSSIDPGSPGIPQGWVNSSTTFSGHAHHAGLGIASFNLTSDATPGFSAAAPTNGCGADPANHCQSDYTVSASTDQLSDGPNTITGHVNDVMGNPRFDTTLGTIKIDRTPPGADVSGELSDVRDEARLTTDSPNLIVGATDDNDTETATSGVQSMKVQIDGSDPSATNPYVTSAPQAGQPANAWTQAQASCDSCSLDHEFQFDTSRFGDGAHTVEVTTTDYAGNVGYQTWDFTIDRTSSKPSCSDPSSDPNGCQADPPSNAHASCTSLPPGPSRQAELRPPPIRRSRSPSSTCQAPWLRPIPRTSSR